MKIAILTFSRSINYGGSLQTYALQTYLNKIGNVAIEIDYSNGKKIEHKNFLYAARSWIWQSFVRPFFVDSLRSEKTVKFHKEFINYTDRTYHSGTELSKDPIECDAFIVGSDQVWNPPHVRWDKVWFLPFTDKLKLSYGASFGCSEISAKFSDFCMPLINNIDFVSVREETGKELIISKLNDKPVSVVMDPVFLLTKNDWEKIAVLPNFQKYVLSYYLPGDTAVEKQINRQALNYAKKKGLILINLGKREYEKLFFNKSNVYGIGPREFLGLISNAEAVFTNSFHGTAFSLIFKKHFLTIIDNKNNKKGLSTRMTDLLTRIDMEKAFIEAHETAFLDPVIITDFSQKKLAIEIENSKFFLEEALRKSDEKTM